MNLRKIVGFVVITLALLSVIGVEAAGAKSQNVLVPYEGTLVGKRLTSGTYQVKCETHGPSATITFSMGGKVVATVEGKVVNSSAKYSTNAVIYETKSDGSRAVVELRLTQPSQDVVFEE